MKLNRLLSNYGFAHRSLTPALALALILLLASSFPAFADYAIAQESSNNVSGTLYTMGQSFTTISAGQVTQIDVYVGAMNGRTTDLRIYSGGQQPDNPAAALYVQTVSVNCNNCWFSIPLTTHLDVSGAALYTFELTNWQGRYSVADPYSGGTAWQDNTSIPPIDFAFRVHLWAVDLALTKSVSPSSAKPGQAITYTIAFSNTGSITATNVVLTDTLSANITDASYTNSGVALTLVPGSQYAWTAPDLLKNDGGVITITGVLTKPLAAGTLPNTVTLAGSGTVKTANAPLTVQNVAPVADAGVDQSVLVSETVTLNGSGMDDNGDALTYGWAQTGGAAVTLSDATAQVPTFTAPSAADVLTFTLTVTDTGALTATDEIVVNVTLPSYTLMVAIAGNGAGSVAPTVGTHTYLYGTVVPVTATAGAGSTFTGWSGDLNGSANPTSITMTGDRSITATFSLNTYTLTVAIAGNGAGSVAPTVGTHTYLYGTVVPVTATAGAGSTFTGWSGDLNGSANPTSITMTGDRSITATFSLNTYTLTVAIAGNGAGSVAPTVGTHTYLYGTVVTLTAVPSATSVFAGWNGAIVTTTNPLTVTMDADKVMTATFKTYVLLLPIIVRS